jgi:hypothetical protein
MFLIHDTACCCGSMQSGKRLAAVVRMPFWTLCSSAGRPFAVQSWMTASLLRKLSRLKFDETGMLSDATCAARRSRAPSPRPHGVEDASRRRASATAPSRRPRHARSVVVPRLGPNGLEIQKKTSRGIVRWTRVASTA